MDYSGLNKVMPLLNAAVSDVLELQYEWESNVAECMLQLILLKHFSRSLWQHSAGHYAFLWSGVQYTWNQLPQGWKYSPTICQDRTSCEKKSTEVCWSQPAAKPPHSHSLNPTPRQWDRGENSNSTFCETKIICEGQKKTQVMQKYLLTSSHKQINAQPVSEQQPPWKQKTPTLFFLYTSLYGGP